MTKVKICGITNLDDAKSAARFGADMLGFNFYRRSPRYISPADARQIVDELGDDMTKVGVFVNSSTDEMLETVRASGIDAVQLHGDETEDAINDLRRRSQIKIVKALRVSPTFDTNTARDFDVDAILLDGYSSNARGGTGETFDWEIAREVREIVPELWLAGGLSSGNVRRAISEVAPYAVDVCSSIESRPGFKDSLKMERFIAEARS